MQTMNSISTLSISDWQSVGTHSPTPHARVFLQAVEKKIIRSPHCFWSGKAARTQAYEQTDYVCDNQVPLVSVLFEKGKKEAKDPLIQKEFFFAISRLFALTSTSALIFLSSDKPSEPPGLTIGTNFWEAELPVLWRLRQEGKLSICEICLMETGKATRNLDLSQESLASFPIYRRYKHPYDADEDSFVQDHYKAQDYEKWRKAKPRKAILFGNLLRMALLWRRMTRKILGLQNLSSAPEKKQAT